MFNHKESHVKVDANYAFDFRLLTFDKQET